jgi:hypothetical protein
LDSEVLYEKIIYENEPKAYQLRLVVNEFRGVQYLHLRKYFLSFEDGFVPSREGASMAASISNIYALIDGLLEICSKEEGVEAMQRYFSNKISDLQKPA